jgi:phytoene desaturase
MADEVAAVFGPTQAAGYRKLVAYLDELYRLEFDRFMDRNLDGVRDLVAIQALGLVRIGGLRSMETMAARFIDDDRLRRLFTFQALYAGVSPSAARAIYGVIPYLDSVSGVWYPVGGMHEVARALAAAAADHGVRFQYRTAATRIELSAGRARAVHTADGQRIRADAVICNVDPAVAYRDLLPADVTPPRYRPGRRVGAPRYSPSAFVWHVGSSQPLTEPAHHSISFGASWKKTFREIISGGQIMTDPSLLITSPSATDASVAPAGRHTYYVLAPAPNTDTARIDWPRIGERYRAELAGVLRRRGLDQHGALSSGIEVSRIVTPDDWAAAGLPAGSPFAAAHTLSQTGPWRHPTRHPSIANLLFCGAAVQPGVGVPTVLLSGRLAAARLIDARANRPTRHLGR